MLIFSFSEPAMVPCSDLHYYTSKGGIFIPSSYIRNIKVLNFTVQSSEASIRNFSFDVISRHDDYYKFETTPGSTYNVTITGKGPDNSWSSACELRVPIG